MMQFRIDSSDLRGLATLWKLAPEIVGEEMMLAVEEADILLKGELQQVLPRGAGGISGGAGLAGSIFNEEERLADNVIGVVASPQPYAEYVEIGTRPHFPPLQPIADWVGVKLGITDEREQRSVAFLIARKISIKGTKGDGSWSRVAEQSEPAVLDKIAAGVDRVLDRLAFGGVPA